MQGVHLRSKPTVNEGGTSQLSGVHLKLKPTHNEEGTSESNLKLTKKFGGTSQI